MPRPPPLPALVHAPAPALQSVALPPPPPPPSIAPRPGMPNPHTAPPALQPASPVDRAIRRSSSAPLSSPSRSSPARFYLSSTSRRSAVPAEHAGAVDGCRRPCGTGRTQSRVPHRRRSHADRQAPRGPTAILQTPDRSRAFLLDTDHGDVLPVNLLTGQVGAPIAVGKLPVDQEMSADGSTLYVTDNLGGTVIPIKTSNGSVEPARTLTQGVDFYVPSPTTSGALVGVASGAGQPGVVYFYNPATGSGSPVSVGANPAASAFYSKDGKTVWVDEQGTNGQPGVLIPVDVATRKPGTAITLGLEPIRVRPDAGRRHRRVREPGCPHRLDRRSREARGGRDRRGGCHARRHRGRRDRNHRMGGMRARSHPGARRPAYAHGGRRRLRWATPPVT